MKPDKENIRPPEEVVPDEVTSEGEPPNLADLLHVADLLVEETRWARTNYLAPRDKTDRMIERWDELRAQWTPQPGGSAS